MAGLIFKVGSSCFSRRRGSVRLCRWLRKVNKDLKDCGLPQHNIGLLSYPCTLSYNTLFICESQLCRSWRQCCSSGSGGLKKKTQQPNRSKIKFGPTPLCQIKAKLNQTKLSSQTNLSYLFQYCNQSIYSNHSKSARRGKQKQLFTVCSALSSLPCCFLSVFESLRQGTNLIRVKSFVYKHGKSAG